MKRKHLLKSMLLLCALIAGSSVAWAETTVSMTTFTAISGNVGGDENVSYAAAQGTATTAPAVNNSEIRVYQNGGTFTVTANNGCTIQSVTLGSSMATTVTYKIDGGSESDNQSISANGTTTVSDVNCTSVLFTCKGTDKNSRLYVNSLSVTYAAAVKTDPTINFNDGSVRVGKTIDLSTLFSTNSEGAVSYSITSGNTLASLDGTVLTGVAVGSVVVKAEQAASALHNASEKSATINVTPAWVLSSISITNAPAKTTYKEGQSFDATGMEVTATYTNTSEENVTAFVSFTPSGALTTSDTEITVSYTENGVTKSTTQPITVNAQSTNITINTNYEWLGVSSGTNLSTFPTAIDCDGLTVTIDGAGTKTRGDDDYIRLYAKNKLKFSAPANHFIKEIIFTMANSKWDNTFNTDEQGNYDNSTKTWTCVDDKVTELTLTEDGSSGNNQISKIEITLVAYQNVTISSAGWASFSNAKALDFTGTGVTAYIAKEKDASKVTLTEIAKVPAETGIVVSAAAGTYAIPVLTGAADATTGNLLKAWLTAGTPSETKYYTLAAGPSFKLSSGGTLAANKSYLVLPGGGAPSLDVDIDDNNADDQTTGISAIEHSTLNIEHSEVYTLSGQRVSQPTKGLYIVNGKKVIVK